MDFVKDTVENKMQKDAQPGNSVEGRADNDANQGSLIIHNSPRFHLPDFLHALERPCAIQVVMLTFYPNRGRQAGR